MRIVGSYYGFGRNEQAHIDDRELAALQKLADALLSMTAAQLEHAVEETVYMSGALTELFGSTLHVNSNATLSGALNVQVNPKHPPTSGATYTALTAASLNDSFTSHTARFTLTISANSIQVTKQ